jgi:hypothetical protein
MSKRKARERPQWLPGMEPRGYGVPAVRVRTSIAAAEAIEAAAPTLRGQVYAAIGATGAYGATREEIAAATGLRLQTVCGRCGELLQQGLIYDCGQTRAGESGRAAVVLRIK